MEQNTDKQNEKTTPPNSKWTSVREHLKEIGRVILYILAGLLVVAIYIFIGYIIQQSGNETLIQNCKRIRKVSDFVELLIAIPLSVMFIVCLIGYMVNIFRRIFGSDNNK